jgi:DNA-binding NtrC family response regulator
VAEILTAAGYEVIATSSGAEALQRLADQAVDLIFTDLMMPGMDGLEFIRILNDRRIESQVVMFTAHASIGTAVQAMRLGAFDYLEKPFNVDQLEDVARRALQHGLALGRRSCVPEAGEWAPQMIGQSVAMQQLRQLIQQAAPTDETVLITGESGTGKELVARAIHAVSQRRDRTWVGLNCPALSPQLMESELFGHERGAFTNADAPRVGRFELADGGTILLDEVSEIELDLQAKLLRVLQERQFERVGSSVSRPLDVRIIASTNRDLHQEIKAGRFREDLFYRLAVIPIQVPPLRRRVEDIPLLARHFLHKACQRTGRAPGCLTDSALDLLVQHAWPGNVRELENAMHRAVLLANGEDVGAEAIRAPDGAPVGKRDYTGDAIEAAQAAARDLVGRTVAEVEQDLILETLTHCLGNRTHAAHILGISIRTLRNKLKQYSDEGVRILPPPTGQAA